MAVLADYFLNPPGIYGLLSLIPLILLYLIRPRPLKKIIPSLMFLVRQTRMSNKESFFRNFLKDWLIIIQILALILLSLALARPFILGTVTSSNEHVVIVLDSSASMQATKDGVPQCKKV